MTSPTNLKTETSYPEEVLKGGGAAIKWIKSLSREQLHSIVQDKNLPVSLIRELSRNAPVKFLKNLVNHKKMEPEFRISIFRRIFRANPLEMKNEEKLVSYNAILNNRNLSDKEKRIVNSYIQEIRKSLSKANKSKHHAQSKPKKRERKGASSRKISYVAPEPPPDATLLDIAKYLRLQRSSGIWKRPSFSKKTHEFKIKSTLLAFENSLYLSDFQTQFKNVISVEDLLAFRMEINSGIYKNETYLVTSRLIEDFRKTLKGDLAEQFIEEFLEVTDWSELLYGLMLKAISGNLVNFQKNSLTLNKIATQFDELLLNMQPVLNYGKVLLSGVGKVLITFSSSLNLEFDDVSFKYWKHDEDESFAFPSPIKFTFNHESRLNDCAVDITNLKAGCRYLYRISSEFNGKPYELEPREFKIPDLPSKPLSPPKSYSGHTSSDYSVPLGGGGERRFQQF